MAADAPPEEDSTRRSGASLRARALKLLARREHSRAELARKLSGLDVDPGELSALLDDLASRGWLSEQRVAEQAVRAARGRYGPRRVLQRLQQQGVDPAAVDQAAAKLKDDELASARAVWQKRFGQRPADLKQKARQARFLAGRGFGAEVIRQVLGHEPDD